MCLECSGISKNTRTLKAGNRGSIVVVFDYLLWMKFVNVVGELQGGFEASSAILTRGVQGASVVGVIMCVKIRD